MQLPVLLQPPGVNVGELEQLRHRKAILERLLQRDSALRVGHAQVVQQLLVRQPLVVLGQVPAVQACLHATQRLLHALLPGAADGHDLSHTLHHRRQLGLAASKLLKVEAGHLGDHVVNGRLKGGGGHLGDVVGNLVQGVPHRQLGRHLGDGEAGGLGCQGGGAADARVHLDDDHVTICGVDGHLHVGATTLHAHLADDGDSCITQALVLLVGQGL
mmetsp:Transcript_29059/g.78270  ORF Transcript_29059/g.78270 Transcript_29059/m.78270 type:complete len:216 (-) Transcript_29059:1056-1703(-)